MSVAASSPHHALRDSDITLVMMAFPFFTHTTSTNLDLNRGDIICTFYRIMFHNAEDGDTRLLGNVPHVITTIHDVATW